MNLILVSNRRTSLNPMGRSQELPLGVTGVRIRPPVGLKKALERARLKPLKRSEVLTI